MSAPTSSKLPSPHTPVTFHRRVAGPPTRSPQATWKVIEQVLNQAIEARAYPDMPALTVALRHLRELGLALVITHGIEEGAGELELDTGDHRLCLTVVYDGAGVELAQPLLDGLLDPLPSGALLTLRIRLATCAPYRPDQLARLAVPDQLFPLSVEIIAAELDVPAPPAPPEADHEADTVPDTTPSLPTAVRPKLDPDNDEAAFPEEVSAATTQPGDSLPGGDDTTAAEDQEES